MSRRKSTSKSRARERKVWRALKVRQKQRRIDSVLEHLMVFDSPCLKAVCAEVKPGSDLSYIETMRKVLAYSKNGVGLAASQIGVTERVCLVTTDSGSGRVVAMINPVLMQHNSTTQVGRECCLSYPGTSVEVERRREVRVNYVDEQFHPVEKTYSGMSARVIQHEIDHLDGICVVGDAWRVHSEERQ